MQESEEHYSLLLSEEHRRVEMVEKDFRSAMREADARLAEAALKEEHLGNQLYAAHMVRIFLMQYYVIKFFLDSQSKNGPG